jgi:PAS domain S-box-containing protein
MSKVFIMNGPNKGKSYDFESNIAYLGRLPDNDIQIKEESISRKHLCIRRREGIFIIRDLNSKNGTFIDGKRIQPGIDIEIKDGAPITIGRVIISLGVETSEELFTTQEIASLSKEFSNTAMFTTFLDRPLTLPKNMDFFYKVSNVLSQSLDINEIMKKILDYIFELLKRIDRGVVILVNEKTREASSVISRSKKADEQESETEHKYSRTIVNKVIETGKPIIMMDTFGQDEANISESMMIMNVKSVMCIPLISKSKVRGVIYVDSVKIPYGFREEDLSLITALASPAAIAIENALFYSKQENIIKEKTQDLKDSENKMRENEKRFRAIFNNMSSGVVVCRVVNDYKDFLILDLNRMSCMLEKVKKKEVVGKSVLDVFPEIRENNLSETFKQVIKTGKPESRLITFSKEGKTIWWRDYYIYALRDDEIVIIFDDITEKKKAEVEQRTLQQQLFVAQKMETIASFAGGTAHNFRNILQAISGNIEYLEAIYGKESEVKEVASNIYSSIDKGVDLINNLLQYSGSGWKMEIENLDLVDVINKTYEIIERVFDKKINIKLELEEDLFIKGNFTLLSQTFMNLFTNARDAMPDGGDLRVKAKKTEDMIFVYVSDTGCGIREDLIHKIFDPFFTTKDMAGGSGLGLSTTLGIIQEHKGSITVSSKYGEGSTFKITLPIAKVEVKKEKETLKDKEIVFGSKQKVLIIDDEIPVLKALAKMVNSLGYEVVTVDNVAEALMNYKNWSPDLVLIDRIMPDIDGIEGVRRLIEIDHAAKIIIISGYNDTSPYEIDEDVKKMIKGYMVKPCNMEELGRNMSQALSK